MPIHRQLQLVYVSCAPPDSMLVQAGQIEISERGFNCVPSLWQQGTQEHGCSVLPTFYHFFVEIVILPIFF